MHIEETITTQEFELLDDEAAKRLIVGRYRALIEAGCPLEASVVLAVHPEVEVARAADLLLRGCPPITAVRILL